MWRRIKNLCKAGATLFCIVAGVLIIIAVVYLIWIIVIVGILGLIGTGLYKMYSADCTDKPEEP